MLNYKQRKQRDAAIEAIRALDGSSKEIADFGPRVLDIFRGVHVDVFIDIDNAIGNARVDVNNKGWMVRRVRNDPDFGRSLFGALVRK